MPSDTYQLPTDEQLARFVTATVTAESVRRAIEVNAYFATQIVMRDPALKAHWLRMHRELQAALDAQSPALPAKSKEME